jgi:hypothetical protein
MGSRGFNSCARWKHASRLLPLVQQNVPFRSPITGRYEIDIAQGVDVDELAPEQSILQPLGDGKRRPVADHHQFIDSRRDEDAQRQSC